MEKQIITDNKHIKTQKELSSIPRINKVSKNGIVEANAGADKTLIASQNAYNSKRLKERPISLAYPMIDNDLARDNVENDLSASDIQDL